MISAYLIIYEAYEGGIVIAGNNYNIIIQNSQFLNNIADYYGITIAQWYGVDSLIIHNCTFNSNHGSGSVTPSLEYGLAAVSFYSLAKNSIIS